LSCTRSAKTKREVLEKLKGKRRRRMEGGGRRGGGRGWRGDEKREVVV
jgi:hypothetical protein